MTVMNAGASPAATLVAARRRRRHVRAVVATLAIVALLAVVVVMSLAVGSRPLAFPDVVTALFSDRRDATGVIVHDLRLPRTLTALLVGSALGIAGVLMQAATRNPLPDPGLLGVNAGAAVGVVVVIAFFGVGPASG